MDTGQHFSQLNEPEFGIFGYPSYPLHKHHYTHFNYFSPSKPELLGNILYSVSEQFGILQLTTFTVCITHDETCCSTQLELCNNGIS